MKALKGLSNSEACNPFYRCAGTELVEMFIPKANREVLQRALSRGNALMVTAVEIDFAFAAASSISATCRAVLSAAALWRSMGRCCRRACTCLS